MKFYTRTSGYTLLDVKINEDIIELEVVSIENKILKCKCK